jgi:hypothetical protein
MMTYIIFSIGIIKLFIGIITKVETLFMRLRLVVFRRWHRIRKITSIFSVGQQSQFTCQIISIHISDIFIQTVFEIKSLFSVTKANANIRRSIRFGIFNSNCIISGTIDDSIDESCYRVIDFYFYVGKKFSFQF